MSAAPGAAADELTVSLESATAYRVYAPHRFQKSQNRLGAEGDLDLPAGLRAHAEGWLLWDPMARLVGEVPSFEQDPFDRRQVGDSRHLEAELRELYVDGQASLGSALVRLRVGKQQVVWGQSFGLRVLDIVNAQDFREFILEDFNRARTPTFGVRVDASLHGFELQGLAFPDFEPDVLPDFESELALEPSVPGLFPRLEPFLGPFGGVPVLIPEASNAPDDWTAGATGFGVRIGHPVGGVDVAVHYWDRPDPRPLLARRVETIAGVLFVNHLTPTHLRVRTLGLSFAAALGDFALWGEGGVSTGRGFVVDELVDPDGYVRRADLQYALGLDWSGWGPLFANVQLLQFGVFDHGANVALDPWRTFLSLLLRFDFRNETVFPQLFVLYGVNDAELMLRPSLEWKLSDRLSLTAGADVFTGPREGLLGQYAHDRRCVPVPPFLPAPDPSGCHWEPQPGRPSRVFLTLRYAFSLRN